MSYPNDPGFETWGAKAERKFKENPWVPLGCLATCGALVMSAIKMRAGKSQDMNYWLRARVILQGVTLVALVAGSMALQQQKKAITESTGVGEGLPRNEANVELTKEQKKEKDREEFEERLRGAEQAHEEEQATMKMVIAARKGAASAQQEATPAPQSTSATPVTDAVKSAKGKWWW